MARYREKPVVIDAVQWYKHGDNPSVEKYDNFYKDLPCNKCSELWRYHGWIITLEGGHIVCPGDWIITGVQGEKYPCKPDIFKQTYELVDEP